MVSGISGGVRVHQAGAECGGESVKGKQEGGFCGDGTVLS